MRIIPQVKLQVALKQDRQAKLFTFSKKWTVPLTVLHLSSDNKALKNIRLLVADDDLACEDLLIGLPGLQPFMLPTCTMLEKNSQH